MPASRSKINEISECAMKARKMYKHIVQSIERFIVTSDKEYKLPAVYVIDCILRKIKKENDVRDKPFNARFIPKFPSSFKTIFENCLQNDKVCFDFDCFRLLSVIDCFYMFKFVAKNHQSAQFMGT